MIFMMYLNIYCRESVGNCCYVSGAQYVVTYQQPVHNFSFSFNSLSKSEFLSFISYHIDCLIEFGLKFDYRLAEHPLSVFNTFFQMIEAITQRQTCPAPFNNF